jgi:hypothetical protein
MQLGSNILKDHLHEFAPQHSRCSQFRNLHVEVHPDCEEKGQTGGDLVHLIIVDKRKGKLCEKEL